MKMIVNNPRTWNQLLNKAPEGAILMGGAIRDFLGNFEAKDYDIFYSYTWPFSPPIIPGWIYRPRLDKAYGAEWGNSIAAVWDYETLIENTPIKIQLVGVMYDDPLKQINNFDHTLTLGVYGPGGMYVDSRLFQSIFNKTVTCTNNNKPDKSLIRAQNAVKKIDQHGADNWTYQGF